MPFKHLMPVTMKYTRNPCQVCGDKARVHNYGALSCPACKTFFRRYGFRPQNVNSCDFGGRCDISIRSRKNCTACRLAKCLSVGMKPHLIRKESIRSKKAANKQALISKSSSSSQLNFLTNRRSSFTSIDWRLLCNVVHAFDKVTPIPRVRYIIKYHNKQSGLKQSIDLMSIIYSSVELFISSTADFKIMTNAEQQSLIKRNMHCLWFLRACLTFRELGVFDNGINEMVLIPFYGIDTVKHIKYITTQLDDDLTFIKLMFMILTFSSNLFVLNEPKNFHDDSLLYGSFRLFGSQSIYVELMWNYMVHRYGFIQSVKRFANLIKTILSVIELMSNINENNEIHHQLADGIIKQTEHSLHLNNHINVPLWGKTELFLSINVNTIK